jgi:Zn-dependent protease
MSHEHLTRLPYLIAALLPALTFHEWAHAMVAHAFGDTTAQRQGRLTLNPFAHLDPIGTLVIVFVGFGWARPVPIDPRNFRNAWGEFWVAAAGPAMNVILAVIFAMLLRVDAPGFFAGNAADFVFNVLLASVELNLALAFFNLIPIGPLDGNHLLAKLLPLRASLRYTQWNTAYGSMFLLGLIIFESLSHIGILSILIWIPVQWVKHLLLS